MELGNTIKKQLLNIVTVRHKLNERIKNKFSFMNERRCIYVNIK